MEEPLTVERVKREAEEAKKDPLLAVKAIDNFVRYFEQANYRYWELRGITEDRVAMCNKIPM